MSASGQRRPRAFYRTVPLPAPDHAAASWAPRHLSSLASGAPVGGRTRRTRAGGATTPTNVRPVGTGARNQARTRNERSIQEPALRNCTSPWLESHAVSSLFGAG
jgi:hypothetical protein